MYSRATSGNRGMSILLPNKPTDVKAPAVASRPKPVRIVSSAPTQSSAPSISRWPVTLRRSLRMSASVRFRVRYGRIERDGLVASETFQTIEAIHN